MARNDGVYKEQHPSTSCDSYIGSAIIMKIIRNKHYEGAEDFPLTFF